MDEGGLPAEPQDLSPISQPPASPSACTQPSCEDSCPLRSHPAPTLCPNVSKSFSFSLSSQRGGGDRSEWTRAQKRVDTCPCHGLGLIRLPQPPETYRLVQLNPLSFCQVHCLPTSYLDLQRRQHALTMALTNARLGEEERVGRT